MRQRILWSTLGLIAVALIALAVPLAISVRGLLTERALDALSSEVEPVATFIEDRARSCSELELFVRGYAEQPVDVSLHDPSGTTLLTEAGHEPQMVGIVSRASTGAPAEALVGDRLVTARALSSRVCNRPLVLRVERADDQLSASVRTAWLRIGLIGATILGIGIAAAIVQGRRLAAPFEELAASARHLSEGDFTRRAPRSDLAEADAIADALDATADRLGRSIQRGQAFAADAGHQLRTPLTALRLNLEALELHDPDTAAAALAEADRLEETIDELVALTTLDRPDADVDVAALVDERVDAWRDLASAAGREVVVEKLPTRTVQVRPAAVGQALQVLLDNALEHGQGSVSVRVAPTLPDEEPDVDDARSGPGVRISVSDEGPGIDPAHATGRAGADRGGGPLPLRGGRGLRLARSLVEAEGGRLTVEPTGTGTTATIVLPGAHV